MKYIVELKRVQTEAVEVYAPSRDEALSSAELVYRGFKAEVVIELNDSGQEAVTHEPQGRCESCNKPLWAGDDYAEDDDGVNICQDCYPNF